MVRKLIYSWGVRKDNPLYDDMYQEGLLAIDSALKTYDPDRCTNVEGWIYVNVRSAVHKAYKKHSHNNEQEIKLYKLADNVTPEDYAVTLNSLEHISNALYSASERDQKIFVDHVMNGKTMTSIAKEVGLGISTIHQIVNRIKLKMRKVLES